MAGTRAAFVTWFDPTLICEPVWDGTDTPYLLANTPESVSMTSSLVDGYGRQPAKPTGPGGSKSTRVDFSPSKVAMRL